ncbi:hypothetical protein Hdeb2414_s0017g00504591 [Helianthus debilis subsp. tardiflorus]
MGQLKFYLIYFRVKTGRQLQRNGSMWVGVLKKQDTFWIGTGSVWIEFRAAGMGFLFRFGRFLRSLFSVFLLVAGSFVLL